MSDLLRTVITGAIAGGVYSLIGVGLVLTYSVTGIFDLGYGGVAFSAALLFYELNTGLGWNSFVAAGVVVIVVCPLIGLALNALVYRPLAHTSSTVKLVTSVGILTGVPALTRFVIEQGIDWWDWGIPAADNVASTPGVWYQPARTWTLPGGDVVISSNEVFVLLCGVVVSVGLWALSRSSIGLKMRSVRDRRDLAALRGVDERSTSRIAAVVGSSVAGLAGVAGAPILSNLDTAAFTVALFVGAAAVVIGRFRSVPWTFAGGLILGIAVNLILRYVEIEELPSVDQAAPFIVLIVGLVLLSGSRERVAGFASTESARVDWRADLSRRQRLAVPVAASAAFLALAYFVFNDYWTSLALRSLALAVILLSITVVTGIGGLVSLAQAAFASMAALTTGLLIDQYGWGLLPAALVAIAAATVLGVVVALPSLRMGGVPFALATLALALMGQSLLLASDYMTNGGFGWLVVRPTVAGVDLRDDRAMLLVVAAILGVLVWTVGNLRRSATGRAIFAMRATQAAASSIGLAPTLSRLRLFAVSSAMAGLGGVLLVLVDQGASAQTTPPLASLTWLTVVVVLGVNRPAAAVVGGLALVIWPGLVNGGFTAPFDSFTWGGVSSSHISAMLFGLAAIDIARNPDGMFDRISRLLYERRHRAEVDDAPAEGVDVPGTPGSVVPLEGARLRVRDLVVAYDLVEAVHGATFDVPPGGVTVLLGANGAGKSTICGSIAGLLPARAGEVCLGDEPLDGNAWRRAGAGVLLVPEGRGVFPGLTVDDNLRLVLTEPDRRAEALERFPSLAGRRRLPAGSLSGGEQQMLSLAGPLADPPEVLIVDEPTLGLAPKVADEVLSLLAELARRGTTVLVAEEKRHTVDAVADHVVLVSLGRVIWQGRPAEMPPDLLDAAYGLYSPETVQECGPGADPAPDVLAWG